MISRASARPRQRTGCAVKSRDRCVCILPSLVNWNLSQRGGLGTLVHGYANPLTIRRFVKLAESPKVLKMLPYGSYPCNTVAGRRLCEAPANGCVASTPMVCSGQDGHRVPAGTWAGSSRLMVCTAGPSGVRRPPWEVLPSRRPIVQRPSADYEDDPEPGTRQTRKEKPCTMTRD